MRQSVIAVVVGLAALWGVAAQASTYTDNNENPAVVEAYNGSSPTKFFTGSPYGSSWGQDVGGPPSGPFSTTGMTITWVGDTINIEFNTDFSGVDSTISPSVYAADIFINSNGGSTLGGFNYAIALGIDQPVGGMSAGLYQIDPYTKQGKHYTGYLTSQDLWKGDGNVTYGGEFGLASSCSSKGCSGALAPTVLTNGNLLSGNATNPDVAVTESYASGIMDVTLTATDANGLSDLEQVFSGSSGFNVFWGTGDCSNAPIFAQVGDFGPDMSVPEPGSVALLASALLCFMMLRRRRAVPA